MAISMDIVQKYIDSALKSEVLEDSFNPFTSSTREDESKTVGKLSCPGTKRILLTLSTSSEPDKIIKHYVSLMAQVKSPDKFDVLFNVLRLLVQQHPNLGKVICESLLSCEKLEYCNHHSWMRSFGLITEILPNVDYKGVRDILKHVLEIIYLLPDRFDTSIIHQLDTLYATFSMILDRDSCLLPAYLSLDELQKKITQGNAPVWKFAELFYRFIESFRPTAQIFSIVNRSDLLPVVGCSTWHGNPSWRLDPISAKFPLKGLLPYKDKLKEPQVGQVRYLLEQPYSRDMVCATLSLGPKPSQSRCSELIEQLAVSIIHAMDRTEPDMEVYSQSCASTKEHLFQWTHLTINLGYYLVSNHSTISFNQLVDSLCDKLKARNSKSGNEHLMWAMLQYITGFPKNSLNDFVSIIKIFDLLYSSRRPLPLPVEDSPHAPHILAAASTWLQLIKRAELDQCKFLKPLPPALQLHYEYIQNLRPSDEPLARVTLKDIIYLNANGANKNGYPVHSIVDCLCKPVPERNPDPMTAEPLPMTLLDSMTTNSRSAILHIIMSRIVSVAQNKSNSEYIITPALIETYARLLVFTDTESFGIKSFITVLLGGQQALFRVQAWSIYHVLLEMYSYRIHHIPHHYKYQILMSMHNLSPCIYSANQMQLSMTMEAAELKLLLGLSNYEALNMPINNRHPNDAKTVKHMINGDSEELNKVLVLVLARSTHITTSEHVNAGLEDILTDINKVTPLSWSSSTLNFFPSTIKDFFNRNTTVKETDKDQLKSAVEEEYRKWKAMSIEPSTLMTHFSQPNAAPLFICLIWRMLLDNETVDPIVYRILDSIRIRTISAHLRTFVDYLVYEFSSTVGGQELTRYGSALNNLIFKFQIISLDRLILCMCLRSFADGSAVQVCFFIMQLILFKHTNIKEIVNRFCSMQSPEHWKKEVNTYETNMRFQEQHPEKYYHDFLNENNIPSTGKTLPSFFGNLCLRLLPVFDILIHRALEMRIVSPNVAIKIDHLFDGFGCLYKFHDKPMTFLYNTLHYYDSQLPLALKKKVTSSIVGAFKDIRPSTWCLSEDFLQYLAKDSQEEWNPGSDYYKKVIGRLVETLQGKNNFYHTDWRCNEFPNIKAHAVHVTAIELMTLPVSPTVVGNAILDLILTSYVNQDRSTMPQWMNAIGLIMTALPPTYYTVLNTKILEYMKSPLLTNPIYTDDILHLMNFCDSNEWMYESQISYLVALTHAVWHHSSTGQIFLLPTFWSNFKQAVETESQFLFVCCLIGPFLSRIERSRVLMDVVVELYEMLGKVDSTSEIHHLNTISDFFYHIKYMFTGDSVKNDIERCIRNFKPRLQYCLRFITHLNINTTDVYTKHD